MSVEIRIEVNQLFNAALLPRDTGKLLVDRLTIINDEIPRNGLIIKISTTPYILELKVPYYIDYLNPNERFEISLDALTDIDLSSLMDLPESYISKLQILLYDDSYNVIASSDVYNIKLLTCNTWPGICKNNNVIAAFLVNTQPSIIEFKNQAFAIITKDADVTERLDLVLSEMYNLDVCVSELPYGYIYRPYKFKIYDELKQNCTCTSMDLALAIATLAESVGLSVVVAFFEYGPIVGILINKKRNVVGCYERWIEELESKNILCIVPENTIAKENKACDLIDHVPESRGNFLFVVDVDNARTTISPISFRLIEHGIRSYISQWEPFHNSRAKIPIRFQKWEGDLLDLTLRNNLLDLGKKVFDGESDSLIIKSKGIIPLKVQDNDSLLKIQKSFLVGNVHALKARASDLDYSSKSSCLLWMDEKYRENIDVIISGCKKSIKDSGQNNTYIAMGLVEWYDSNDVMHIAPLTLLSVRISSDWRITHNDIEDVETNIILLEKLRRELGYNISKEIGKTSGGWIDPQQIASLLAVYDDRIKYYPIAVLGNFTFDNSSMWFDLHTNGVKMIKTPYVMHLLGEKRDVALGLPSNNYNLDNLHPIKPIDSSQIEAINAALSGSAFILQGPPGTGKSQTIFNIICELMYRGKTVLFVSAKSTALEIISNQMEEVGFREFYLKLFGQISKKDIICNLSSAVSTPNLFSSRETKKIDSQIRFIDNYYETIFSPSDFCDISFYDAYNMYIKYSESADNTNEFDLNPFSNDIKIDLNEFISTTLDLLPDLDLLKENPENYANYGAISKFYKKNGKQRLIAIQEMCRKLQNLLIRWKILWNPPADVLFLLLKQINLLKFINKTNANLFFVFENINEINQKISNVRNDISKLNNAFRKMNLDQIIICIQCLEKSIQHLRNSKIIDYLEEKRDNVINSYPSFQASILKNHIRNNLSVERKRTSSSLSNSNHFPIESIYEKSKTDSKSIMNKIQKMISDLDYLIKLESNYSIIDVNPFVAKDILDVSLQIRDGWKYDAKPHNSYDLLILAEKQLNDFSDSCNELIGTARSIEPIRKPIDIIINEFVSVISKLPKEIFKKTKCSFVISITYDVISGAELYNQSLKIFQRLWKKDILEDYETLLDEYRSIAAGNIITRSLRRPRFLASVNKYTTGPRIEFDEIPSAFNSIGSLKKSILKLTTDFGRLLQAIDESIKAIKKEQKVVASIIKLIENNPKAAKIAITQRSVDETQLRYLCHQLQSTIQGIGLNVDWRSVDLKNVRTMLTALLDKIQDDEILSNHISNLKKELYFFEKQVKEFDQNVTEDISEITDLMNYSDEKNIEKEILSSLYDCIKNNSNIEINHLYQILVDEYNPLVKINHKTSVASLNHIIETQTNLIRWIENIADYKEKVSILKEKYSSIYNKLLENYIQYGREKLKQQLYRDSYKCILDEIVKNNLNIMKYRYGLLDEYLEKAIIQYDSEFLANKNEIGNYLKNRILNISSDLQSMKQLSSLSHKRVYSKSLREIMHDLADIIQIINPCVIANVQSVSKVLDFDVFKFDYVIFDESSQIPVAEAIGSLSRGDCPIIVGDINQLPPTKFFKLKYDTNGDDYADAESFLEECISSGFPTLSLSWHYRSNHESLIAFSNNEFYNNKLNTFPSVTDRISKVNYRYVGGKYDRGGQSTNLKEAEAIVDELFSLCEDSQYYGKSIGIITFGTNQMNLISRLINRRQLENHSERLDLMMKDTEEPLFVRNLETIQGDERDIILISICYGRDWSDRLIMNFGPLNHDGGWKRLNVAISRARDEMRIFSSIHYSDIITSQTSKRGIVELKRFLQYAEEGVFERKILSADVVDPLVPTIAKEIQNLGYVTDVNIGKSELRIDIAVVDSNNKDRYILAVLLDKNLYINSRNSIDRDYTKLNFLKKMGWNVFRVWTVDWYRNKNSVIENIKDVLSKIENE